MSRFWASREWRSPYSRLGEESISPMTSEFVDLRARGDGAGDGRVVRRRASTISRARRSLTTPRRPGHVMSMSSRASSKISGSMTSLIVSATSFFTSK